MDRDASKTEVGRKPPILALTLLLGLIAALLIIIPLVASEYITWLVAHMLILALFAVGFNLLFGYTGLLSFGHAGFYAVGGYVCAKILLETPLPLLLGLVGGVLAAGLVALIIGYLSVRHTDIYFAMLTLAFGMMIYSILIKWRSVTGGDDGLVDLPRHSLIPGLAIDISAPSSYYYVVLILMVLGIFALWRVAHSSLGLTLQAIRDSESRVAFSGLLVRRFRVIAFAISGMSAGLAGALLVTLSRSAFPDMAHWTMSAEPVLATLLGGAHSFAGPIVGSFLLYIIKELIQYYSPVGWMSFLGIMVVILVLVSPGGIMSILERLLPTSSARREM